MTDKTEATGPETKAQRRARRRAKMRRGELVFRSAVGTGHLRVALVRDTEGRPKFDGDPRKLPVGHRNAYKALMTPEEIKEYFE